MSQKNTAILYLSVVAAAFIVSTSALPNHRRQRSAEVSCLISGQIYYRGSPDQCVPCNSTCTNAFPPCSDECKSGCACPIGQVINEKNNSCIDIDKCPDDEECKLDNGEVLKDSEMKTFDCKTCICLKGLHFCSDPVCPECKQWEIRRLVPGKCCPVCEKAAITPSAVCALQTDNGNYLLQEGESMSKDSSGCTNCTCRGGSLECYSQQCQVQCSEDEELQIIPYQCCPNCVPRGHVIPVIGK